MGGMHPVVAVYSTFLNRAFDQLLMDCALHRLGVTVVLDRAGVTGEDGPSHHGMWDMSLAAIVPGLRMAAPRDAATLAEELHEALDVTDGPTVLRFPKGAVPATVPGRPPGLVADGRSGRPAGWTSSPNRRAGPDRDVLLVAVGAFGAMAVEAARLLAAQGIGVTVVDPRWALPVPVEIDGLAARAPAGGHRRGRRPVRRRGRRGHRPAGRHRRRRCTCWRCRRSSWSPPPGASCWSIWV